MKVSISKSVARAFEAIELFRDLRKPVTATEMRRHLDCPHSSMVAVLHNLADLGYLSYAPETRYYFPTEKLTSLATWAQPILRGSGRLKELAAAVALETGQTTAISCRNSLFLNIVHVRKGIHASAKIVEPGIGISLCRSIPGLAILSQMSDEDIEKLVEQTNKWALHAKADQARPPQQVVEQVREVRSLGVSIGYNWSIEGTGAIAFPLISPFDGTHLAISVTGETQRIRANAQRYRQILEHYLKQHSLGGVEQWARFVAPNEEQARFLPKRGLPAKPEIQPTRKPSFLSQEARRMN